MVFLNGLFASPFTGTDAEIDPTTEEGKKVLAQPAATKWELWGYYLYYNGVCTIFFFFTLNRCIHVLI